jgi:hypothetical protein
MHGPTFQWQASCLPSEQLLRQLLHATWCAKDNFALLLD